MCICFPAWHVGSAQKEELSKKENISSQDNGNITHRAYVNFSSGCRRTDCEVVHRCSFGLRSEVSCIKLPIVSIVILCLLTKIYKALHKTLMPCIRFICIGLFACPWTLGFTPALPLKQPQMVVKLPLVIHSKLNYTSVFLNEFVCRNKGRAKVEKQT